MIETWIENNKLYTKKEYLRNWEFNAKLLSEDKFNALRKDREELLDIGTLLVMPETDLASGEEYLLVLGGNQRNQVDGLIGKDKEGIELVNFKQLEDGRWYVETNLIQTPDTGEFVGEVRSDLRSFPTKFAAMKTYSYKHNSQYAGYNPDELANDMSNPELQEVDWGTIFANVGEPKSLQDYADRVAPDVQQTLEEQTQEEVKMEPEATEPETTEEQEPTTDTPPTEDKPFTETFAERLVNCPDCGATFDPKKYPAPANATEDELDNAALIP